MDDTRRLVSRPWLAALVAVLLVVPFFALNLVVVHRLDPVFSWMRPGVHTGPYEYLILGGALLLIVVGAVVALSPLRLDAEGRRRFPPLNIALAVLMVAGVIVVGVTLGQEIYACDIAGIPNCD